MTPLEFWIGSLVIASVRRTQKLGWFTGAHFTFCERKGGYRSLLFKLNSTHFHWRKEEQRREIGFVPTFSGQPVESRP